MLNINMQLERDNVSSAGPLQSIASAFVRSFLVHAAGVFKQLMLTQSSNHNERL